MVGGRLVSAVPGRGRLAELTLGVLKRDPRTEPRTSFGYVDIAAIDQDTKEIVNPAKVLGGDAPSRARQILQEGDVLVSTVRPNLNAVAYVGPDHASFIASTGFSVLRPRPSDLDSRFLFHWVQTPQFVDLMVRQASGASYPAVSDKIVKSSPIPLPPIGEQRRIAAVLDAADALRAKRRQALAKLHTLTQAIFIDMFGDPVPNPRGIGKVALGDLVKFKSGEGLTSNDMRPGAHLVYGGNGVNGSHDEYMFDDRRVVVGRVGVYCGCVHISEPRSWITDNALYVASMSDRLRLPYLAASLELANLNQYASQAAQPLISGSRIYPVEILVPSISEQLAFESCLDTYAGISMSCERSSSHADTLFASLQQRAFRGEL